MIEFILGTFLVILIRNFIIKNINIKAQRELYQEYRFSHIFKSWQIYIPLFFMFVYIYFELCVFRRNYWFVPYQQTIKTLTLLSYIPLIFKYNLYESIWNKLKSRNDIINILTSPLMIGTCFIIIGTLLNTIVINANNGHMPVFPSLTYATGYMDKNMFNDGLHVLGGYNTKLIFLSDFIDLFGYSVASIGDILMRLYVSIIIYFSVKSSCLYYKYN